MKTRIETIWLEYNKELKRFVLSKINDKDTANDILQDVFLKVHSKIDTLKDKEKIKSWLYQITRNIITDHFRKQKFSVSTDSIDIPAENHIPNTNGQFAACVQPHINKLPLIYKEALTKTEFQNYSQLQLADELNISYSGAKSRVQRAKELLKKYFKECCDVSTDKYGNVLNYNMKQDCKMCGV
jgi:RNA polymerase sigma-70 factor (ECF subfamily)